MGAQSTGLIPFCCNFRSNWHLQVFWFADTDMDQTFSQWFLKSFCLICIQAALQHTRNLKLLLIKCDNTNSQAAMWFCSTAPITSYGEEREENSMFSVPLTWNLTYGISPRNWSVRWKTVFQATLPDGCLPLPHNQEYYNTIVPALLTRYSWSLPGCFCGSLVMFLHSSVLLPSTCSSSESCCLYYHCWQLAILKHP